MQSKTMKGTPQDKKAENLYSFEYLFELFYKFSMPLTILQILANLLCTYTALCCKHQEMIVLMRERRANSAPILRRLEYT